MSALLLLLSWLIPLHFLPWVSWHGEMLAFAMVFLLAWRGLLKVAHQGLSKPIIFPWATIPLLSLGVVAIAQAASGLVVFRGDVLVFELYVALCVICMVLGFSLDRKSSPLRPASVTGNSHPRALIGLAILLVMGALVSAVVAFAQVLELWDGAFWINRMPGLRRPGGNLGQPNHLATLLLMGVASLLYLYESDRLRATSSMSIFLVLAIALGITESRTGALSFLLLAGWWFGNRKRSEFRASPWIVAFACVAFLAFLWMWPSIFVFLLQSSGVAEINIKPGMRLVVWPQLLEALGQRPWLGWGLNQVPRAHNAVLDAYELSEPFSYSHNILLDLALGTGVPLTALLILVIGVWLWRRVRKVNQLLAWYCLAVALPLAVHSMLEFPFAYAYFLVPVMFALGALEGMVENKRVLRIGVGPSAVLLLTVTIVAAWSVVEYVAIEEDFRVARFESMRVGQTPLNYQRPEVLLLTQLGTLLDGARISPRPGMTAQELAIAQEVALRYPWIATQSRYALSLALNGNPGEAVRQLRVLKAMHGDKKYEEIRANWRHLSQDKYPQLRELKLP